MLRDYFNAVRGRSGEEPPDALRLLAGDSDASNAAEAYQITWISPGSAATGEGSVHTFDVLYDATVGVGARAGESWMLLPVETLAAHGGVRSSFASLAALHLADVALFEIVATFIWRCGLSELELEVIVAFHVVDVNFTKA